MICDVNFPKLKHSLYMFIFLSNNCYLTLLCCISVSNLQLLDEDDDEGFILERVQHGPQPLDKHLIPSTFLRLQWHQQQQMSSWTTIEFLHQNQLSVKALFCFRLPFVFLDRLTVAFLGLQFWKKGQSKVLKMNFHCQMTFCVLKSTWNDICILFYLHNVLYFCKSEGFWSPRGIGDLRWKWK